MLFFMRRKNDSSRLAQERMGVWLRGCLLVGLVALLMVTALSVQLYRSYRVCPLDVSPERINPNTASIASLVRLPGIGKARAMDIIYFRQTSGGGGEEPVFKMASDLEAIKGIGPKTVENLSPWLTFDEK
jgi:hypothetical protein